MVEYLPYKQRVIGSSPITPTTPIAFYMREWLSGRALPCQGKCREFESRLPLQINSVNQSFFISVIVFLFARDSNEIGLPQNESFEGKRNKQTKSLRLRKQSSKSAVYDASRLPLQMTTFCGLFYLFSTYYIKK